MAERWNPLDRLAAGTGLRDFALVGSRERLPRCGVRTRVRTTWRRAHLRTWV
jgi:hypothetical protein